MAAPSHGPRVILKILIWEMAFWVVETTKRGLQLATTADEADVLYNSWGPAPTRHIIR